MSIDLDENQVAQIRSAAVCEIKGLANSGTQIVSNPVALVQLYQLLRERQAHHGGRDPRRTIEETGENLVSYVDSLGSVRDAVEFFNNCSIRFFDGESASRNMGFDHWKPRDPFKPDTPPNWLNLPKGGSPEELREAIREFVESHQSQKLYKHVRRGNLNGLPNFLDIFRTLNSLLLAYHARSMGKAGPVIPFGYVSSFFMHNLELLIGPFEEREDQFEGNGFVAAIRANFEGDKAVVRDRLREERVPQMLRAAVEAMIDVRGRARKMQAPDPWAMNRLRWVSEWIKAQGLEQPTRLMPAMVSCGASHFGCLECPIFRSKHPVFSALLAALTPKREIVGIGTDGTLLKPWAEGDAPRRFRTMKTQHGLYGVSLRQVFGQGKGVRQAVAFFDSQGTVIREVELPPDASLSTYSPIGAIDVHGSGLRNWVITLGDGTILVFSSTGQELARHSTGLRTRTFLSIPQRNGPDMLITSTSQGITAWQPVPSRILALSR